MRIILVAALVSLLLIPSSLALSCGYSTRHQPPTVPPDPSDNEMSAAFREQARRAVDAISRIPFMPTLQSESEAVSLETRKLDAEKATDEAKYKVATAKDREVLKMLDAYLLARTALSSRSTRDLDAYAKMDRQCAIELAVTFNTGELREDIKREAENKTCLTQLAQQDAVTKERLRKMGVPSP